MSKLLVIRRNRLGDSISILPWLQGLKDAQPELEIDVLTNPYASPVFKRCELVRKVFVLPEKYLGTPLGVLLHPTLRLIRSEKPYDYVVNASYSFSEKASILAYFVPGHQKAGVISKHGKFVDRVWTNPVSQKEEIQAYHQVQRVAYIGDTIGLHASILPAAQLLNAEKNPQNIALCPEVNRHQSKWAETHWLKLEEKLKRIGFPLIWLGAKPAQAVSELVRPTSTEKFLEAVAVCKMVICCEGGTSHIAPALGIPTIVLSGMCIKDTWIPWSKKAVLLEQVDVNKFTADDVIEQVQWWGQYGEFKPKENVFLNNLVL